MTDLKDAKPCPFCGSEAKQTPSLTGTGYVRVGCSNAGCPGHPATSWAPPAVALEEWNTRYEASE